MCGKRPIGNGAVAAKYRLLAAVVVSIAIRCEPCIRGHRNGLLRPLNHSPAAMFMNSLAVSSRRVQKEKHP
ncbi:MAG: carboxymuconolactone decarboxylase family protein [Nitrospiraceae bacterium]